MPPLDPTPITFHQSLKARSVPVPTSKAEEYRAKAIEQTVDSVIKEKLLKIAQQWRDMAAYEEKHTR